MAAPQFLSLSGNEITDASRIAAHSWSISQSGGGQTDGLTDDGSLFIGRAATNLFRHGQCDATTDWGQRGGGVVTRTIDTTTPAPFSPQSIKCACDGGGGQGFTAQSNTALALVAGTNVVGSVYFKGVAGLSYVGFTDIVNTDASVTAGSGTTFVASGDWQLVAPAAVAVATGKTGDQVRVNVVQNARTAVETLWAAHAMLETGQSVVAPYVPTSGGVTATKAADKVQASPSLLDQTQGAVVVRVAPGWDASNADGNFPFVFCFSRAANAAPRDGIDLIFNKSNSKWTVERFANAVSDAISGSSAETFHAGDPVTLGIAWDASKIYLSVNGSPWLSHAITQGAFTGPLDTIDFGSVGGAGNFFNGRVKWVATFTGTLTDQDAANIAASGDVTPHGTIPSGAQCTGMFPFPGYGNKSDSIRIA